VSGATGTALRRLDLDVLPDLPPQIRPRVDPRSLQIGIVHLGIGAFHRAHQAVYTEDAMGEAGGDWGICGATQRSRSVVDQLAPQDGLYALAVRGADGERLRVIASVREVVWARADPDRLLERMAGASTAVITLTITEKGYHRDPASDRLRTDSPELAADIERRTTRTAIGQLVAGLDRRRRDSGAPVTVVCCDNLPSNGRVLEALVTDFVARRGADDGLAAWITEHVRFPATMVDRITPATTPADRTRAAAALGAEDRGLVVTEPFSQWVIEDDFAGPRPAWERAGAILTGDVAPYEQIKLRMLNGSHSTLAYLGQLADYEFVADAVASPAMAAVIRALFDDDVAPTLEVPAGFDLARYAEDLLARFANPALAHRTAQIAMDGSEKLPQRLLGTVRDRLAAGAEPLAAGLGVAAWMRVVAARRSDSGRPLPVDDPLAEAIALRLRGRTSPGQVVDTLLGMREIFAEDLAGDRRLRDLLADHLEKLTRDGAERTAQSLAG
jgi:fructuronate reductase